MEEISNLIKEAKPLYFSKKRRNAKIRTTLAMLVCVVMAGTFYPEEKVFYDVDEELYIIENTSVVANLGLPTDDFGLLMIVE